jgi:tyrosine-specific transport protein
MSRIVFICGFLWVICSFGLKNGQGKVVPSNFSRRGLLHEDKKESTAASGDKKKQGKTPLPASTESKSEVWNAIALVTGTTVGAGVLALPSSTAAAGFGPSTLALLATWAFMASTGLLFAEIATNLRKEENVNSRSLGILAMTDKILGKAGSVPAGSAYLLIHYALLVAYIAGAGAVVSEVCGLPQAAGPVIFTAMVGGVLTFGSNKLIDQFNNCWVVAVVFSFLGLMGLALPSVNQTNLQHSDFSAVATSIPTMLVALVYHNVVPTICSQLNYNKMEVTKAIVIGSVIPLLMFLLWNAVILGISPFTGSAVVDPLESLRGGSGGPLFSSLVNVFSEAAIITSFTGFVIGLLSFFQDLQPPQASAAVFSRNSKPATSETEASSSKAALLLYAAVLIPPTVVAVAAPDIFSSALDFAGSYGITVLFGAMPIAMAAMQRANRGAKQEVFLPGGAPMLAALMVSVTAVVAGKAVSAL